MEDSGIDSDSKTNSCNGGDRPQQDLPVPVKKLDGCEADMNEAEGAEEKPQEAPPEEPQKTPQEQAASKSRALQLHRRLEACSFKTNTEGETNERTPNKQESLSFEPHMAAPMPLKIERELRAAHTAVKENSAADTKCVHRHSAQKDTPTTKQHKRIALHMAESRTSVLDCLTSTPVTMSSVTPIPEDSPSRLPVPNKGQGSTAQPSGDTEPLVTWKSDSEEDFEFQPTSKAAAREITQQLIRDGYDLDLTPDDDDLDLIPPKPLTQRCSCCNPSQTCSIM